MPTTLLRPYCTLVDVQRETRNSDADLADKMRDAINLASRFIEELCARDFWFHDHASAALSIHRRWVIGDRIFFPWPILSITEAVQNGTTLGADTYIFDEGTSELIRVAAGSVELLALSGEPHAAGTLRWYMPDGGITLTVKGTFGYALAGTDPDTTPPPLLPGSVRRAATLIAAAWSGENRKEQIDTMGQKTSLLDLTIPKEVRQLLNRYVPRFM